MRRRYAAAATAIVAVLVGVAYMALRPSPAGETSAPRPGRDDEVVAFSADGWLWSYRPTSARRLVRVDAPADPSPAFGRYVAVNSRGELVVLSPRPAERSRSCTSGVVASSPEDGCRRLLAKPRESTVCGEEMTLPSGDTLVTAGSSGQPAGGSSRLQWIGLATGRVEAEQTASSAVLALAPAP